MTYAGYLGVLTGVRLVVPLSVLNNRSDYETRVEKDYQYPSTIVHGYDPSHLLSSTEYTIYSSY